MEISIKVRHNLDLIGKYLSLDNSSDAFTEVYETWATIYRAEMMERYSVNSRGGGEWPPLASSTIARRRIGRKAQKGQAPRKVAILINTGTLFNTMQPVLGQPGQLQEVLERGVRVGIGGSDPHPSGVLTIGQLALYHQEGGGRLPQRKILVEPNQKTQNLMADALAKKIVELNSK